MIYGYLISIISSFLLFFIPYKPWCILQISTIAYVRESKERKIRCAEKFSQNEQILLLLVYVKAYFQLKNRSIIWVVLLFNQWIIWVAVVKCLEWNLLLRISSSMSTITLLPCPPSPTTIQKSVTISFTTFFFHCSGQNLMNFKKVVETFYLMRNVTWRFCIHILIIIQS